MVINRYKQTGPTLPLDGPILVDDVYKDLRRVFADIDPSEHPLHIGNSIREKARRRVQQGIDSGALGSWRDVHELIQEQDEEDLPLEEGQEAFDFLVGGDDDDQGDDSDGDDDEGGLSAKASGSAARLGSASLVHSEETCHTAADIADPIGDCPGHCHDPAKPIADAAYLLSEIADDLPVVIAGGAVISAAGVALDGSQPNASSSSSSSQAAPAICQPASSFQLARELLHREALRSRDDSFARTLRKHMAEDTKKRKAADGPEAVVLRDVLEASKQQEIRRRADAALDQQAAQIDLEKKSD